MLKSIDAIFISTPNMPKLIEFYQTLGIPLKVNNHGGGLHAEANIGDIHFALQPWRSHETPIGNVTFSFHVPNLEDYCHELEEKGFVFTKPATPMSFGGVIATIKDPDGNQIFLNRWQTDEEYAKNFPAKK